MKTNRGFIPISLEDFVEKHLKSNPGSDRAELVDGLQYAIAESKKGTRCQCGEPLWIVGSGIVGLMCFTCITGEAMPDEDYEIEVT